jgi:hypothetical protein
MGAASVCSPTCSAADRPGGCCLTSLLLTVRGGPPLGDQQTWWGRRAPQQKRVALGGPDPYLDTAEPPPLVSETWALRDTGWILRWPASR